MLILRIEMHMHDKPEMLENKLGDKICLNLVRTIYIGCSALHVQKTSM